METFIIVATVIVFVFGIFHNAGKPKTNNFKPTPSAVVLSEATTFPSATPTETPVHTNSPTLTPNVVPQLRNEVGPGLTDFKYPNANVYSENGNSIGERSVDDANIVRKWYESKVNGQGYNNVSWQIKNNSNNGASTQNYVLTAGKDNFKVKVTITKNPGDSQTNIFIELQ